MKKLPLPFLLVLAILLVLSACQFAEDKCEDCDDMNHFICENGGHFKDLIIGDGHCVSLIKHCSSAPKTAEWRPGDWVKGNQLEPGTVIATFKEGRYPSHRGYHAAIYIEQNERGIWVWDQWQGKPVHKRLIRWENPGAMPNNTGTQYRVVLAAN